MRKPLLVFTAALFSIFAGQLQAADLKIGVVNSQKLIAESPQAATLRDQLQQEFAPQMRELQSQQNEIKTLQEKFKRDEAVMSESERSAMERRMRDLVRDFQYGQQTLQEDQRSRYNEGMGRLQNELRNAIQGFAKAEGYDLILTEPAYSADALDVTDQVLARMKK